MASWRSHDRTPLLPSCGEECLRERLKSLLPNASTLLNAGCGRGAGFPIEPDDLAAYRGGGGIVLGCDVDPGAAANPYVDRFILAQTDIPWPLDPEAVDLVLADWVLEHLDDPAAFVGECFRVLRPGGVMLARTLQAWSIPGIGATLVPNRFHSRLTHWLAQDTAEEDVFPTRMRVNTYAAIASTFGEAGFRWEIRFGDGLSGYCRRWPWLEKTAQRAEELLPRWMAHTAIIEARKPSSDL
jgi:SAM-dependent methyltransferase